MGGLDPKALSVLGLADSAANDAHAIVVAAFKKFLTPLRTVLARAAHRAELAQITIQDGDPNKKGLQHATIRFSPPSADFGALAAQAGAFVTHSAVCAELFIDEGRRLAMGMPEGPKQRGLDGEVDQKVSDMTVAVLGPQGPKGIFGIDDAFFLAVVLPAIVALLPVILPFLMTIGGSIIQLVTGPPKDAAPPAPPPPANVLDDLADKTGIGTPGKNDTGKVLVILAVLVGVVLYLRKKGGLAHATGGG